MFFCINSPEDLNEKQHRELPNSLKTSQNKANRALESTWCFLNALQLPVDWTETQGKLSWAEIRSDKTLLPGMQVWVWALHLPQLPRASIPRELLPPPCAPTHPWLSFSPPFKSVWEEVKVTPLPLSQEWVPQLQHVPVHNAVLPKGVIYRKRKRQEAKQSHPTHVLRRWKPRARWLNLLSTRMEPILT